MNIPSGYTWDGDEYCPDCLPVPIESEDVAPLYPFTETGRKVVCAECGVPIETGASEVAR